jgi:hypothetical protein
MQKLKEKLKTNVTPCFLMALNDQGESVNGCSKKTNKKRQASKDLPRSRKISMAVPDKVRMEPIQ